MKTNSFVFNIYISRLTMLQTEIEWKETESNKKY